MTQKLMVVVMNVMRIAAVAVPLQMGVHVMILWSDFSDMEIVGSYIWEDQFAL